MKANMIKPSHSTGAFQFTSFEKRANCIRRAGNARINMGAANFERVLLFSRDTESIKVPIAINQPQRERAVKGVNFHGNPGMSKLGKMKTKIEKMVSKPPQKINN